MPNIAESYLEPEYQAPYTAWKTTPTPQSTGNLLRAMQPAIDRALVAHGDVKDPILRSNARKLALDAVKKYDPYRGVKLSTHVIGQLQTLRRVNRQQQQIVSVPERVSMDRMQLEIAETEMNDELGRNPTIFELSDRMKLSPKRIKYIRQFKPVIAEGTLSANTLDEEGNSFEPSVVQAPSNKWLELVHADLDPIDQKIMEWSFGLYGTKPLNNQSIATKLRLSPGAISQRKSRIQKLLDDNQRLSPF